MARSPRFKVYTPQGEYVASCKRAGDASAVVCLYGEGASIRDGHSTRVWVEGVDGCAGDSYDAAAELVLERCEEAPS